MNAHQLCAIATLCHDIADGANAAKRLFLRVGQHAGQPGCRALRGKKGGNLLQARFICRIHIHPCGAMGVNIKKPRHQAVPARIQPQAAGLPQALANGGNFSVCAQNIRLPESAVQIHLCAANQTVFHKASPFFAEVQNGCWAALALVIIIASGWVCSRLAGKWALTSPYAA